MEAEKKAAENILTKMNTLIPELLALLKEVQEQETPIIVEGINDKNSLEKLGLANILLLNKPVYELIEQFPRNEVIILTDFDQAGKKLYAKINHECSQRGIRVNNQLRHFLMRETGVKHIEHLYSFIQRRNAFKEF
ncbi:toprim domain-containing protein [Candidatus Woesearchaeota archaeon]|nr:toprim domain-containing protein [Candidatus Woesearchaeota archaeon]